MNAYECIRNTYNFNYYYLTVTGCNIIIVSLITYYNCLCMYTFFANVIIYV